MIQSDFWLKTTLQNDKNFGPNFMRIKTLLFVPIIENGEELCIQMFFLSFQLFFSQNQIPQTIIKQGQVIYHFEAFLN